MEDFESICRRMLPAEEAERMISEHKERIRQTRLHLRDGGVNRRQYQQRLTGVIPKPSYNAAKAYVKKKAAEQFQEDAERAKKGKDFLSQIPTEFRADGIEKWVDKMMIDNFLCDMARQGILVHHPFGGWMAASPKT